MIHHGIAIGLLVVSAGILFVQVYDSIEMVRDTRNAGYFKGQMRVPMKSFLPYVLLTLLAGLNLLYHFNILPS